ncbi:MAG: GldG family protein [Akkermansiaceae bacterium]|nr:GldG family protein [Akkermansiaceae bacterium]
MAVAVGGFWYFRPVPPSGAAEPGVRLSDSSRAVLSRLKSPLEIRFYALLGEADHLVALKAFSGRVDELLSAYEREAGGNIKVVRNVSRADADLDAAAADGITAFNLNKGEPCYLGLSVAQDDQKESLARITPEWEQALEADLTRAIMRVSGAQSLASLVAAASQAESSTFEEVKRAIPDLETMPVDEGRQVLREASLKELKVAAIAMQTRIQEAEQRLIDAQKNKSEAGLALAMKEVQQAHAAQAEKLKEIAARLDAQVTALERLKGVAPSSQ